jgi:hypothetical protein
MVKHGESIKKSRGACMITNRSAEGAQCNSLAQRVRYKARIESLKQTRKGDVDGRNIPRLQRLFI